MLDTESVVREFVDDAKVVAEDDFDYLIDLVTDKILGHFENQPIELGEAILTSSIVLNKL